MGDKPDDRGGLEAQVLSAREALSLLEAGGRVDPTADSSGGGERPVTGDDGRVGIGWGDRAPSET